MKACKTQMRRIISIHNQINDGKYPNCASIAKEWEVSTKTIQRDFEFLKDQLCAPLQYDRVKKGYFYTDSYFSLPSVFMSETELLALAVGTRALEAYTGTPIANELESALKKLGKLIPVEIITCPEDMLEKFSFTAPPGLPIKPTHWNTIAEALVKKRQLEIEYKTKTRRIHPLHMANLHGQWYLFARFYDYEDVRQISLGRITNAKILNKPVNSENFDINDFTSDTLGRFAAANQETAKVVLEFANEVADGVVEREWHKDQKIEKLDDGRVVLSFSVKGDIELKRWIMSWGQYCKVIEPEWVQTMIDDEVNAMLANR